jgi:hypothetical protein
MELIKEFARGLYLELAPIFNWALKNWSMTAAVLLIIIYWAIRHRRLNRHP